MKILVTEEEINEIEDILYDFLAFIRNGFSYLRYFFETKNYVLFNAYRCLLNKHLNGFYDVEFSKNNMHNKELYNAIDNIRFSMSNYKNDYERLRKRWWYKKYLKVLNNVKIVYENDNYYIQINELYKDYLTYGIESYLNILNKDEIKIIKIFKKHYVFDESNEEFIKNYKIALSYLDGISKHINKKFVKEILNKIKR